MKVGEARKLLAVWGDDVEIHWIGDAFIVVSHRPGCDPILNRRRPPHQTCRNPALCDCACATCHPQGHARPKR